MKSFIRTLFIAAIFSGTPLLFAQHDHDHDDHDHPDHDTAPVETEHDDHEKEEDQPESGHEKHDEGDHGEHEDHDSKVLNISPEVLAEFDIRLGTAGPGTLKIQRSLPGEIHFNQETMAVISPRFEGTVRTIEVRLSDQVRKGQILGKMESTETLQAFDLRSPIDGTVVEVNVTPGQHADAGTPLYVVADLSTVWADLRLYQRTIGSIKKGQPVELTAGHDQPAVTGIIDYISPVIDEHTRTGLARAVLENPDRLWKPGQFISGRIAVGENEAEVLIPLTAVIPFEGEPVVFVQTEKGLELRSVTPGRQDSRNVEILRGLTAGETLVIQNPVSLKAELGKASFGGHAGHAH